MERKLSIRELQELIKIKRSKSKKLYDQKEAVINKLQNRYDDYRKELKEFLKLPEEYRVNTIYVGYDNSIFMTIYAYDQNNKPISSTEITLQYETPNFYNRLKETKLYISSGSFQKVSQIDKIKITSINVFTSLINNLEAIKDNLTQFSNSIQSDLIKINKYLSDIVLLTNSICKLEIEIFEINKKEFLEKIKENDNTIKFDVKTRVNFRNKTHANIDNLKIIKRVPKGDYKINIKEKINHYEDEFIYHEYITSEEFNRLIKLKLIEDRKEML